MTFADTTEPGNEQLIERIRKRIQSAGRITFAEFMEAALYDPDYGYYTTGRETVGVGGDFVTSPIMHPAFGMTIAHWLESQWKEMGSPKTFDVVEMGAGKGVLSAVILHYFSERNPELLQAVRYRIVEKRSQAETSPQVEILDDPADIQDASINGCIFSNELVDAFPVHLVTVEGGRLREIFVSETDGRFIEVLGEPSTPKIRRYFEQLGIVELPEEYRTEVNLKALEWIKQMSSKLAKGSILTIDYGYPACEYYRAERRRGTLLCYYRQMWLEDPYVRIGQQDITAHVDFTSLTTAGEAAGLSTKQFMTQRDFLTDNGIRDYLGEESGRRAIMALLDPRGMGNFKVLIQGRP